jgi:LysR family transcriptional regulator, glycine cleavage system transcriptional activator
LVAVCGPSLQSHRKLRRPADLRRHVLLHDDAPEGWSQWLARQRAHGVDAARGTVLVDSSMLVEAAVQGQGIALARLSLALGELSAGRLVLPFPTIAPLPTTLSYYLVAPRENLSRPAVAAFCEWLRREVTDLTQVLSPPGWAHYTSQLPQ